MVAGTHSGVGKTTVATGLMAALRRAGRAVAPAKVGPDFIDPGYHQLATGRPGRNLDPFLSGPATVPALAARAAHGADLLIVEGVMGLFDGVGADLEASTAHVAELLEAPVVLVVDASSMSRSVVALVGGYDDLLRRQSGTGLAGVVLNRVGSDNHEAILRQALEPSGLPVLGVLRRDERLAWRDRHLGLVPVVEHPDVIRRALELLASAVEQSLDLAAIERLARQAPTRAVAPLREAERQSEMPVPVAVVSGPAFSFAYRDNLERLAEAGAELVPFDPLVEPGLPSGVRALYAGGGYPEVYAEALAANQPLLEETGRRVREGLVTWAECGGLLWLARSLDGHRLCGAVPADARMGTRIHLGYRTAIARVDSPVARAGQSLRAHELHYSTLEPEGDAFSLEGRTAVPNAGWAGPTLTASYLHLHLGADPAPAERFVATAARRGVAVPVA